MRHGFQDYKRARWKKNENIQDGQENKIYIKASKRTTNLKKAMDSKKVID